MKALTLALFFSLNFIWSRAEEGHWCYQVEVCSNCEVPTKWSNSNSECGKEEQSPVNIVTKNVAYSSLLKPFTFQGYGKVFASNITNNGHSAQLSLDGQSISIKDGGLSGTYVATQLHFHWGSETSEGSEHSIDGERFPMELHIVHKKSDSDLAVLGFFYKESSNENEAYKKIITALQNIPLNGNWTTINDIKLEELIPKEKDLELYYRYKGSLTTPPCSETVTWTLFPVTIPLGKEQLAAFYKTLRFTDGKPLEENFRPVQKLGKRTVQTSDATPFLSQTTSMLIPLLMSYLLFTS